MTETEFAQDDLGRVGIVGQRLKRRDAESKLVQPHGWTLVDESSQPACRCAVERVVVMRRREQDDGECVDEIDIAPKFASRCTNADEVAAPQRKCEPDVCPTSAVRGQTRGLVGA